MATNSTARAFAIAFGAIVGFVALLALAWYGIYTPVRQQQRLQTLRTQGNDLLHSGAVDLQRYAGDWYEIARKPNPFERGCVAASAKYTLENGTIVVENTCTRSDGTKTSVVGSATPLNAENTALQVSFAPRWLGSGAAGDYWILHVDSDYRNALVGSPDRKYLWLLSRKPNVASDTREKFSRLASEKGFDVADFASGAQQTAKNKQK